MYAHIGEVSGSLSKYTHFSAIMTKLIGENMFCLKAHQLSIVLLSKSRLVQLRIYTSYTKTCFFPWCYQGRIQDFKLGGAYLKKLRRAEGGAKIFGVFRVKIHDFTPKKNITECPSYP